MPARDENADPQSFTRALFAGRIHEDLVFPFPQLSPDQSETLHLILETLRRLGEKVDSAEIDRTSKIPPQILEAMREMGLFGLAVPEAYGGLGLSQTAYGIVCEALGGIDASLAVTVGAHASIGMKALLLFGTKEQKERYLPKLTTGEMLAAFALTEPGSGSDAFSIKTRAVRQSDGSYVLSGNKLWITNGSIADFFTVFAKTEVETDDGPKDRMSAFIVTRDMKGFASGREEHKMGIRGSSTTELSLTDVRVPPENVLGEIGHGFKMAMEVLNSGRLGLSAGCVGGAKEALKHAAAFAVTRKQFGRPIAEFGLIQEKLAQMAIDIFVSESVCYLTCGLVDRGVPDFSIESAISKIDGSEMIFRVCHEALQVAGGTGYMQEYPYERMLRDARINTIFEGTNQILTCFVALTGMKDVGDQLKLLGRALNDPIASLGVLYDHFVAHRIQRSLQGERITKAHPEMKREASMIEEHVGELASAVEAVLRKHRKKIVERQFVQKRLSDIAMDLYRMVAVVSRTSARIEGGGPLKAEAELDMARSFCREADRRIVRSLRALDRNTDVYYQNISRRVGEAGGYPLSGF